MAEEQGQELVLAVAPSKFQVIGSRQDRAIGLVWTADTGLKNVIWVRWITLRLGWPPIVWLTCFKRSE